MDIEKIRKSFQQLAEELKLIIVGKDRQIEKTLVCLLAEGHLLLEDMPGVGKTTLASALAHAIGGIFSRIQFTADLLPSDVIGTRIYRRQTEDFEFIRGAIFANVVLADELNRAPPKTQSALLQAMNEFAVSVEKQHIELVKPFMVIATQNPKGFHGTYPLPESQRDRFMMRISLGYPDEISEVAILKKHISSGKSSEQNIRGFLSLTEVVAAQDHVRTIPVADPVLQYISRLMAAIRLHDEVELPVSPRGSIALMHASQAFAFYRGQDFVSIDTVKEIAPEVLAHRIGLRGVSMYGGEGARNDWLAGEILQRVEVE
ncbi:MAG TPA: MoxR family ATPase [Candidatus Rifleibacterium sp.]|jgi:MoxR-like ATPase|nr:MoxR family ATPase [Candidatus Rifleibacterium sp.]HOI91067.1 MoxR family ATPase [Candidatus Rifleibacterium sp.]HPW57714.1 MoxR family ATPase [Candidatus Rifleibacterium sp.]HQB82150.1 MoxR family ATPase [Candidatus Rifleibacterium sp.]